MALYSSKVKRSYRFWGTKGTLEYLYNINPNTGIFSHEEREMSTIFFGNLQVKGPGKVRVIYPFTTEFKESVEIDGQNLLNCNYVLVEARPDEGAQFIGWYSDFEREISSETKLVFTEDDKDLAEEVTFYAKFQ